MRAHHLVILLALSSCGERSEQISQLGEPAPREAIVGTWKSDLVVGEWGESYMVTTFTDDGRFIGSINFTDSGAIALEGTYTLGNGILYRTIEGRTEEIEYRIDGATMHQTVGEEHYTFRRQEGEQAAP